MFAFEKLPGLPRDRIVDAIAPVLRAHGLRGVELVWRTDAQGRVLSLTLEPDTSGGASPEVSSSELSSEEPEASPGPQPVQGAEGVTLEVCSRVSRDVSTALDVLSLIEGAYRLEVGSPGLERRLYGLADYERFKGRLAKLKLAAAIDGHYVIEGRLVGVADRGVAEGGVVLLTAADREHAVSFEQIKSAQLVVDWQQLGFAPRQKAGRRSAAQARK